MILPRPYRGVIPPMVTPLAAPDQLDVAALEHLVAHIVAGGVDGLFILGTTGEGPSLSYEVRRQIIERVCSMVGALTPVLVGITDTSRRELLELADFSAQHGASALVVAAPYYYPLTQPELAGYIERLAPELPLPFFLYNMPSHTKVAFEPETVRQLADLPTLHGLKDSSGNLEYFRQVSAIVGGRPDFSLLMGPEELLVEAMRNGAHGGVCGGANLNPQLYVQLYQAARDGQLAEIDRLQSLVLRIGRGVYGAGGYYLRGLKCAMSLMGLCSGIMAEPFEPLPVEALEQVRKTLVEISFLPESVAR